MLIKGSKGHRGARNTREYRWLQRSQETQGVDTTERRVCKEMYGALCWTLSTNHMSLVGT